MIQRLNHVKLYCWVVNQFDYDIKKIFNRPSTVVESIKYVFKRLWSLHNCIKYLFERLFFLTWYMKCLLDKVSAVDLEVVNLLNRHKWNEKLRDYIFQNVCFVRKLSLKCCCGKYLEHTNQQKAQRQYIYHWASI